MPGQKTRLYGGPQELILETLALQSYSNLPQEHFTSVSKLSINPKGGKRLCLTENLLSKFCLLVANFFLKNEVVQKGLFIPSFKRFTNEIQSSDLYFRDSPMRHAERCAASTLRIIMHLTSSVCVFVCENLSSHISDIMSQRPKHRKTHHVHKVHPHFQVLIAVFPKMCLQREKKAPIALK